MVRGLRNPAIGNFEVETLINEPLGAVCRAIEDFFVFSDARPEDFLLLYFSGHGVTDEGGRRLYLTTVDTQLVHHSVRRATAVAEDFVKAAMQRSRSRRQVILLDCCHSGAFAEGLSKSTSLPELSSYFQGSGRMVLAGPPPQRSGEGCHCTI